MRQAAAAFLLLALVFIGCSDKLESYEYAKVDSNLTLTTPDEIALANRFLKYWDARSHHDFKTSFSIELPYIQYTKLPDTYHAEGKTTFEGYQVILKKIDYKDSKHQIATIHRIYIYKDKNLDFKSKWIKVNGTWYHKYDFSLFPQS